MFGKKRCPTCGQPMTHFTTGWKCMNIKAHDKAVSQKWRKNTPEGGRQVRTVCPSCENGKRFNKKKCRLCKGQGRIWTIK